jgi:hypothetical protein
MWWKWIAERRQSTDYRRRPFQAMAGVLSEIIYVVEELLDSIRVRK